MDTPIIPLFQQLEPTTFQWPVKVPTPGAQPGKYVQFEFMAEFKYLSTDEFDQLVTHGNKTDREVAEEVLLAVHLVDAAGEPVPSSPALIAQLLDHHRVPLATVSTYIAVMRGVAAEKN